MVLPQDQEPVAHLGVAPIAWSNDDLPELGGETPLEVCLSEARKAGFSGVEIGGKFPKTPEGLCPVLEAHDLKLCGGWFSGTLLDNELDLEKERIADQMHLFKSLAAPCIVYGETAGTLQGERHTPLSHRRMLEVAEIRAYGHKMTAFAEWCAEQGMPIAYHHHMAAPIETERDLDLLMTHSGEALALTYDPGHMAFAGGDVMGVIKRHSKRIRHVHTKDVRKSVIDNLKRQNHSFLDAVLLGAFTVPGDGSLDYGEIIKSLAGEGYEGWFVIEAEQDPIKAPPYEYACIGYAEVSRLVSAAGYTVK